MTKEKEVAKKQNYMTFEEMAKVFLKEKINIRQGELGSLYHDLVYKRELPRSYWSYTYCSEEEKMLLDQVFGVHQDLQNPDAKKFLENLQIIIGSRFAVNPFRAEIDYIIVKPEQMADVFLKLADTEIKDEKIKYDALKYLTGSNVLKKRKDLWAKILKNPNSVTYDYKLAIMALDKADPDLKKIYSAMEKKVKVTIVNESENRLPDFDKLNYTKVHLHDAAKYIDADLGAQVEAMYFGNDGAELEEFLAQVEKSSSLKITELTAQVEGLNKQLKTTENQLKQTAGELEKAQAENQKLANANEKQADKLNMEKKYVKQLLNAAEELRIGIGSRGIRNMRKVMNYVQQAQQTR
ncbi:MAG: hypothetical protein E7011_04040 [Alphaproteobacteria bacterium]|nr:hypothetical protein [Alphaproteobacteria bacterium]